MKKFIFLSSFLLVVGTLQTKDLGTITNSQKFDFEIPAQGQESSHTFTPTTGAIAHNRVTVIMKHEIRSLPHGKAEILNVLAKTQDSPELTPIVAFSVNQKRKKFSDMIRNAQFSIDSAGRFHIDHQIPEPNTIDVVTPLSQTVAKGQP